MSTEGVLKLLHDVHCIGFDMDHTIVRYNLPNLYSMVYDCLVKYLVENENFDKALLEVPIRPEYTAKGLIIDRKLGNIIKVDENKCVVKATHGLITLTNEEVKKHYPQPIAEYNGHHTQRYVSAVSYFEVPLCPLFLQIVAMEDSKNANANYSAIIDALVKALNANFGFWNEGRFFQEVIDNTHKYIYKATPQVIEWLKSLKSRGVMLFLITNSFAEYTHLLMTYCYGEDFHELFDAVVVQATKPAFFTHKEPFLESATYFPVVPSSMAPSTALKSVVSIELGQTPMPIYVKGNVLSLIEAVDKARQAINGNLEGKTVEKKTRFCYVGDNMIGDVMAPKAELKWITVAIVEELDHFYHNAPFNSEDAKYGKSHHLHHWGSFFFHTGPKTEKFHTFWAKMIRDWADFCCFSVDDLAAITFNSNNILIDTESLRPCTVCTTKL